MTVTDWLTIVAIFLGPIVAVRVTRYLDDKKEARERKLRVFKTLMATRGAALSPTHVEALNLIDLEFSSRNRKDKEVIDAWKAYLDHLQTTYIPLDQWGPRRVELLVELLHKMSIVLKYQFDKTHVKNAVYSPRGHGELDDDQTVIRRGLRELFEMKKVIPMYVTNWPAQAPQQVQADESGDQS